MDARSSTAVGGSGAPRAPRLVLAILVSLAAFFAATVRPATLSVASATCWLTAYDADAPIAIEEGAEQCRVPALRPPRDGRGHGVRVRDFAFDAIRPVDADWASRVFLDDARSGGGSRELAPMRRVRKHVEVMVFLT